MGRGHYGGRGGAGKVGARLSEEGQLCGSLALREWDREWVSFDERIVEEAQTRGAAQGGASLARAPPTPAATSSIGNWAMIIWSPPCWGMGLGQKTRMPGVVGGKTSF